MGRSQPSHLRRHSQPVNTLNATSSNPSNTVPLANLDDIFADFKPKPNDKPQTNKTNESNESKESQKSPSNQSAASSNPKSKSKRNIVAHSNSKANGSKPNKQRRHSMVPVAASKPKNSGRRDSVHQNASPSAAETDELSVAKKTGYDIAYFIDKDVAYKYLCIMLSHCVFCGFQPFQTLKH